MSKKLLVLIHDKFQDYELIAVLSTLIKAKVFTEINYFNFADITDFNGQYNLVNIKNDKEKIYQKLYNYDAIFIPGGQGAQLLRKDSKALNLISDFIKKEKWVFAICDAPNALFENNVFDPDTHYTAYPIDNQIKGTNFTNNDVVQDKNIITARSASCSLNLALKIIEIFNGIDAKNQIEKSLNGA
ncbi:DJ-1/PfpI family protein [[Mycoplasma] collis]|uniref:DJ-1/PfpI family protein n=1 Tax=[Mycoplasma] collis TaxID=2127 RepID=UPI00051C83E0|nr:DJ-1/PfpI family protein [[Mycoplasma] collis]